MHVRVHVYCAGKPDSEIFHAIRHDPLVFGAAWASITPAAKELIAGCLDKDPLKRYTVEQALAHPWVAGEAAPDTKLEGKVLECLQAFSAANKFKRAAVTMVAKMLTADDVRGLRETFMKLDKDGSGTLTTAEVREAITEVAGSKGVDAKAMMAAIDADGDGTVNWEEFLHASMEAQMVNFQRQIWEAFCELDTDGSGTITVDELRTILKGESEAQIARYMEEYDLDKDGTINYEEFLRMLLPKTCKCYHRRVRSRPLTACWSVPPCNSHAQTVSFCVCSEVQGKAHGGGCSRRRWRWVLSGPHGAWLCDSTQLCHVTAFICYVRSCFESFAAADRSNNSRISLRKACSFSLSKTKASRKYILARPVSFFDL